MVSKELSRREFLKTAMVMAGGAVVLSGVINREVGRDELYSFPNRDTLSKEKLYTAEAGISVTSSFDTNLSSEDFGEFENIISETRKQIDLTVGSWFEEKASLSLVEVSKIFIDPVDKMQPSSDQWLLKILVNSGLDSQDPNDEIDAYFPGHPFNALLIKENEKLLYYPIVVNHSFASSYSFKPEENLFIPDFPPAEYFKVESMINGKIKLPPRSTQHILEPYINSYGDTGDQVAKLKVWHLSGKKEENQQINQFSDPRNNVFFQDVSGNLPSKLTLGSESVLESLKWENYPNIMQSYDVYLALSADQNSILLATDANDKTNVLNTASYNPVSSKWSWNS